jgi:hypothetical protein
MKNKFLYILTVFMAALTVVTVTQVNTGFSEGKEPVSTSSPDAFLKTFCFNGELESMDVADVVDKYTEKTNEYFNENIKYIMTKVDDVAPSPNLNDYPEKGDGLCRNASGVEQSDMTCQAIAVCNQKEQGIQSHPFCMAMTLMGVSPERASSYDAEKLKGMEQLKYGYLCYRAALEEKRKDIYDSTPQSILKNCKTDPSKEICKLKAQVDAEKDPDKREDLQDDLDYELNQRRWWSHSYGSALSSLTLGIVDLTDSSARKSQFIDEEIDRAKVALDQTLDAYSQLKTAWQMHTRYMDVFAELVKYRDHLVAIRKQTDTFPLRFIDATSTKCL